MQTCTRMHTGKHTCTVTLKTYAHTYICANTHAPTGSSSVPGRLNFSLKAFAHQQPFPHPSCKAPALFDLAPAPFSKKLFLNTLHQTLTIGAP